MGSAASTYDDQPDLVESRFRELSPGRRRQLAVLVVLAVVAAAILWNIDGRRRTHEFRRLLSCVATAEETWAAADRPVSAMGDYVRPSVDADQPPAERRKLYGMVAAQAVPGVPVVRRALRGCQAVRVLPFHGRLRAARSSYLAWLHAAAGRLSATAADGAQVYASSDELTRLRSAAFSRLSRAAPGVAARRQVQQLQVRS